MGKELYPVLAFSNYTDIISDLLSGISNMIPYVSWYQATLSDKVLIITTWLINITAIEPLEYLNSDSKGINI